MLNNSTDPVLMAGRYCVKSCHVTISEGEKLYIKDKDEYVMLRKVLLIVIKMNKIRDFRSFHGILSSAEYRNGFLNTERKTIA